MNQFTLNIGFKPLTQRRKVVTRGSNMETIRRMAMVMVALVLLVGNASAQTVYDIIFCGDSITYGYTATQAPPAQCMESLNQRFNVAVNMSNQGHPGHTTVDWLPSTNPSSDFHLAVAAAASLESSHPGQLVFSIMLGVNDSAQIGPTGAPVSPTNYLQNLQSIVGAFLTNYPSAVIFVHYPSWYSTNTEYYTNTDVYLSAGLARLQTYFPEIDQLISNCTTAYPGHVFAGDKGSAFNYFSTRYLNAMTPESGPLGTFYLHPNAAGASVLGGQFWANPIAAALNFTTNKNNTTLPSPRITGISLNETMPTPSAANGLPNGTYYLLASTNLALPLSQSTRALTNIFDGSTEQICKSL